MLHILMLLIARIGIRDELVVSRSGIQNFEGRSDWARDAYNRKRTAI
jgi:hypothetical protein